ncbi:hypothetical protein ACRAWC_21975 [Leifsonia sp. L25]
MSLVAELFPDVFCFFRVSWIFGTMESTNCERAASSEKSSVTVPSAATFA